MYRFFISAEDFDESELMKELEDLEQDELNNELLDINIDEHKLPEVPASDIKEPIIANKDKKCKHRQFVLLFRKFQYVIIFKIFSSAKTIDDDDDMKNLLAWAN